ncbi:helix-turn-helix transcriptional regulator [Pleomorphovibrio marinus]|uniref:helix-turn-helix transcriptional regulator n=1 Tax=Pleomorphovibrio marinus TaxID=2164132 RepID=UPI0018E56440|nr:helix-turn-helix transcriptional regulator [Pleomorphovibrio marinus]
MTESNNMPGKIHQGRNIKRFREMLGIKQEALAHELGADWSQKKISLLEQKETVEEAILAQVSEILNIPVEAIQNFDEEQAVNIIANTFENCNQPASIFNNSQINPLDQLIKLHEEKIALYERMLKEKDEMMARLEKLLHRE